MFFNTAGINGYINQEAKNILKFIANNIAEDDFTGKLAHEVQKIKQNKEWQVEYMTLLMREREKYTEGKIEGKVEGKIEGRAYSIVEFALELNYSDDQILSMLQKKLNIEMSQAEEYLKRYYEGTL